MLHAIQHEIGYVDDSLVPVLAGALNLSRADVHGVITFYHDFRRRPAGRNAVKLCRAESCQARGGAAIEAAAVKRMRVPMGETRHYGRPIAGINEAALDRIAIEIAA